MYYTSSAGKFRFQIRVPRDLVDRLGHTPLRIPLNSLGVSAAKRTARLLAGHAEGLFIAVRNDGPTNMTVADKTDLDILSRLVAQSLEGGPQRPLLSESLEQWTNEIRYHEGIDPKKVRTDQNRINDFKEFAGDRPVNKYEFFDFQKFTSLLARVPSNYSKLPELRGKTRQEAADYNSSLKPEERLDTLVGKSIEDNYLSPLRMFFRDVAAQYQFRSPLTDVIIRIPKDAKESVDRVPFEVEDLNLWFAHAAKLPRQDHKWLPLLGTITGARVGELVYLQGKDVYPMTGADGELYWVLDLRTDLIDEDGGKEKRQVKNKPSRRLIALHEVFEETGFIKYARDRDPTQWVFPAAFRFNKGEVKDPADAASKRMNNMLKKVGIHKSIESTFHSTRHNAKDAMRLAHIDERTSDLQSGHRLPTVSRNYGKKHLKAEEVEVLSAMPLPSGLDLGPYYETSKKA
jgi:integrase